MTTDRSPGETAGALPCAECEALRARIEDLCVYAEQGDWRYVELGWVHVDALRAVLDGKTP